MFNRRKKRIEEARKIFFKYNGSIFQMERELEYDAYKKFSIPKKMESEWFDEILKEKLVQFNNEINEKKLVSILSQVEQIAISSKNINVSQLIYTHLKSRIENLDSFVKLRTAETIINILERLNISFVDDLTYSFVMCILKEVMDNPSNISVYNLEGNCVPDYMIEEKIVSRVMKAIDRIKRIKCND